LIGEKTWANRPEPDEFIASEILSPVAKARIVGKHLTGAFYFLYRSDRTSMSKLT